jgi:hypothetical protein
MAKRKSGKQKSGKSSSIGKQRGGKPIIDLNRKDDTNYDSWIQCISIGLLVIALFLGVKVYLDTKSKQRVIYQNNPQVIERPQIIERPVYINDNNFYEEKIERRLEPPGVIHEPRRYVPINTRTRGQPTSYQQVGILTNISNSNDVRPLYGRQTYRGSNSWNYYSSLDSNLSTKIPIFKSSDKCTDERGCQEINDGDNVTIGNISTTQYTFTKYSNDSFRYIPDLF